MSYDGKSNNLDPEGNKDYRDQYMRDYAVDNESSIDFQVVVGLEGQKDDQDTPAYITPFSDEFIGRRKSLRVKNCIEEVSASEETIFSPVEDDILEKKDTVTTLDLSKIYDLKENNQVRRESVYIPVENSILLKSGKIDHEFSHLKYTEIQGDPEEFTDKGYNLRVVEMNRKIELFIIITMYNEDISMFIKTWDAVLQNISYLCTKKLHSMWNSSSWEKIAICVVADGRKHLSLQTLSLLGAIGLYQVKLINSSNNADAHLFEVTSTSRLTFEAGKYEIKQMPFPLQTILLIKEDNSRKINSHRWFFSALCKNVNPNICITLDIGTRPAINSFYEIWREIYFNDDIGGACGELHVDVENSNQFSLLVSAQVFEYKLSNILSKPVESLCGYIPVLPGAFSAYRYRALKGDYGTGPLVEYFLGDYTFTHSEKYLKSFTKANMYLAEDRILGFEVTASKSNKWRLKFVKSARASTDIPESLHEFLNQRRRWINGTLFASIHTALNMYRILDTGHSIPRKFTILVIILHNTISTGITWFLPANFYIFFYYIISKLVLHLPKGHKNYREKIVASVNYTYIVSTFIILIISLSLRDQGSMTAYGIYMVISSIIMAAVTFVGIFLGSMAFYSRVVSAISMKGSTYEKIMKILPLNQLLSLEGHSHVEVVCLLIALLYIIGSIMYGQIGYLFRNSLQYILLLPTRANLLTTYSYCNLHDITWGTKGLVDNKKTEFKDEYVSPEFQINKRIEVQACGMDTVLRNKFLKFLNSAPKLNNHTFNYSKKKVPSGYSFRSKIVVPWVISNIALSVLLIKFSESPIEEKPSSSKHSIITYIKLTLWMAAILSAFQIIGSFAFHVFHLKDNFVKSRTKMKL